MKTVINRYLGSDHGQCVITRTDKRNFHSESVFLYHVKNELIRQGHDVIKKRMHKDGHLVSDTQQYIRSRHFTKPGSFCIFSGFYAIRGANEDYNAGKVVLEMVYDLGEK